MAFLPLMGPMPSQTLKRGLMKLICATKIFILGPARRSPHGRRCQPRYKVQEMTRPAAGKQAWFDICVPVPGKTKLITFE
jgi:hypothetical protein